MESAAHVSLSYFDWASVLALASLAWLLLRRDFQSRDALSAAVAGLTKEVAELRSWISERYVSKEDHRREIDLLREDIRGHAERFQSELESHRDECPARR